MYLYVNNRPCTDTSERIRSLLNGSVSLFCALCYPRPLRSLWSTPAGLWPSSPYSSSLPWCPSPWVWSTLSWKRGADGCPETQKPVSTASSAQTTSVTPRWPTWQNWTRGTVVPPPWPDHTCPEPWLKHSCVSQILSSSTRHYNVGDKRLFFFLLCKNLFIHNEQPEKLNI